jgi:hypothetical protein
MDFVEKLTVFQPVNTLTLSFCNIHSDIPRMPRSTKYYHPMGLYDHSFIEFCNYKH